MNIRAKAVVGIALATVLSLAVSALAVQGLLAPRFRALEDADVRQRLLAVDGSLGVRFAGLDAKVVAYAFWDDSQAWFTKPDEAWLDANLSQNYLESSALRFFAFLDHHGHCVGSRIVGSKHSEPLSLVMQTALTQQRGLWQLDHPQAAVHGLVDIDGVPWMVAARPSLSSDGQGPIRGVLIAGVPLDAVLVDTMAQGQGLVARLLAWNEPEAASWREAIGPLGTLPVVPSSERRVDAALHLRDVAGGDGWILVAGAERNIWRQGRQSMILLFASALVASLLFAVVVLVLIERGVLSRIARLGHEVTTRPLIVTVQGNDEIAQLAANFCRTSAELSASSGELALARDAAEVAARTRADLLAAVSHELRTPLNSVLGMVRLLQNSPLAGTQRELTEIIRTSGESMLALVNDLLDASRLEAGKLVLDSIPFDPRGVVEEASIVHLDRVQSKGVELAIIVESDVPRHVEGDPGRFRQIVHNLVSNAAKFTNRGEVVVRLSRDECSDPGQMVLRVSVSDTGIGISKIVQQRLFNRYEQGDSSTARRLGGSGLGLWISKELSALMGGDITFASTEGEGCTMTATIRCRRIEKNLSTDHDTDQPRLALIAEGHQPTAEGLSKSLASLGWRSEIVTSLSDTCERLSRGGVHLLFFSTGIVAADQPATEIWNTLSATLGKVPAVVVAPLNARRIWSAVPGLLAVVARPVRRSPLREALLRLLRRETAPTGMAAPAQPSDQASLTVLVIDDSVINQRVAQGMLKRLGCHVDLAANGLEGLECLRNRRYDLVVLDCQMPVLDGFAMSERWRAEEAIAGDHTLIVALTADVTSGVRDRCLHAGMDDYLMKPVEFDSLASAVRRALSRRSEGSGRLPALRDPELDPPAPPEPLELDRPLLEQVRILGDEGFCRVIDRYLEAMPGRLDELETALSMGNLGTVGTVAHQIVGESGLVGLRLVEHLARCIELAARGENRMLNEALEPLRGAFLRGRERLLAVRDEPAPPTST